MSRDQKEIDAKTLVTVDSLKLNLTQKQARFAELIAAGKSQRQAYIEAYDTTSSSMGSVDVNASRLANTPKVADYITVLKRVVRTGRELAPNDPNALPIGKVTKEWVRQKLREEAENTDDGTATSRIRALELLGKTEGMFDANLHITTDVQSSEDIMKEITDRLMNYIIPKHMLGGDVVDAEVIDD